MYIEKKSQKNWGKIKHRYIFQSPLQQKEIRYKKNQGDAYYMYVRD